MEKETGLFTEEQKNSLNAMIGKFRITNLILITVFVIVNVASFVLRYYTDLDESIKNIVRIVSLSVDGLLILADIIMVIIIRKRIGKMKK